MKHIIQLSTIVIIALMGIACGDNPKVIKAEENKEDKTSQSAEQSTGIFSNSPSNSNNQSTNNQGVPPVSKDVHSVVVKEVLPTDKYVYLKVEEEGETFWIATMKQEVETGKTYFYKEGLLKTNFESKEYDRIFDRIYLVSKIVPANHGQNERVEIETHGKEGEPMTEEEVKNERIEVEGSISIAEIVENPEKYKDKEVQVSGRVTKVNPNIMDRNWVHLKDGTKDEFDLVLTTQEAIPEGAIVTMVGTVHLDRDFGAGYRYDIIIENASLARK